VWSIVRPKLAEPMRYPTLNRRHQAGLFLVVVAAGVSLFLEASIKQTTGIALIGLAATWLLGSLSIRAFSILCCLTVFALGFSIAAFPFWEDWQAWNGSSKQYALAIEDLRLAIASAPVQAFDPDKFHQQYLNAPKRKNGEEIWEQVWPPGAPDTLPEDFIDKKNPVPGASPQAPPSHLASSPGSTKTIDLPESAQEWKRPNVKESGASFPSETPDETILRSIERDFLIPAPTFSLWASLRMHLLPILLGFALAAAGLSGCGWCIRSSRIAKRNQLAAA